MTFLLVGNPTARSGRAAEHLERAAALIVERGTACERLDTEPEGRTVQLVRDAVASLSPTVVVTFGGDGTFNEVAQGILASGADVPLGMLPMGTANNQGRSFGLSAGPSALADNLDVVFRGNVTALDVGHIARLDLRQQVTHETLFFDSVGWGMQPEILARRNERRDQIKDIPVLRDIWRDQAVYAGATVSKLLESYVEPVKFNATIESEGVHHRYDGLTDLVISNTALYAGEWIVDRNSEPDDGRMELCPFQGRRDWLAKTVRDLTVLGINKEDFDALGFTQSEGYSARDFDVEMFRLARDEVATQVDGEEWHAGFRFQVSVRPNALNLITPAGFVPPWR